MISPSPSPSYENAAPPPIQNPFEHPTEPINARASGSSPVYPVPSNTPYHLHQYHSNLPTPPPVGHQLSKGRTNHPQQKFKLLRKGKERERHHDANDGADDGAWVLEGPPSASASTSSNGIGNGNSSGRTSLDLSSRAEPYSGPASDPQGMEVLASEENEKKEKKSKGRGIVKKTSRLFARDKDKSEKLVEHDVSNHGPGTANSNNPHGPLPGTRQASYSSAHSTDSQAANGGSTKSHNHFPNLTRPLSHHSRNRSPLEPQSRSHSRRASQDSTSSWRGPARSVRSGSSSLYDSPNDVGVPIPVRQGSQLSASVPGLSRHNLPQPAPSQPPSAAARSPETFPSRMSTWFSHLLPSTSTSTIQEGAISSSPSNESSPNLPPSPLRKPPSAAASFLNAARQRAVDGVRHLLDSEAQPDKCADTIWVMGVAHPGWRPSTPNRSPGTSFTPDLSDGTVVEERRSSSSSTGGRPSPPSKSDSGALRPTVWSRKQKEQVSNTNNSSTATSPPPKGFSNLFTASTLSLALPASMSSGSPSKDPIERSGAESPGKTKKDKKEKDVIRWPDQFYDDFRSRIWCTYRSQYAPILSLPTNLLIPSPETYYSAFGPASDLIPAPSSPPQSTSPTTGSLSTRPSNTGWGWPRPVEERGLTSDAGWGCMLRTGQSVLANALIHLHLGRDWRTPLDKPSTQPSNPAELADLEHYAEYVRILSWFLDDPSPLCPFSVHRMALIGKELGKEVGEWFGPSTAAGALKTLTNSFSPCKLAVATATDSIIYRSDVYVASNLPSDGWDGGEAVPKQRRSSASTTKSTTWGEKGVLVLVGIRLGLDGVNPIYYDSIKALFTFPQSVGIAGGRPSSSYYFVGTQANSLFYLDPHFTRPAIPLETPPAPAPTHLPERSTTPTSFSTRDDSEEEPVVVDPLEAAGQGGSRPPYMLDVVDVDEISSQSESEDDDQSAVSSSPSSQVRKADRSRTSKAAKKLSAKGVTPPRPTSTPQSKPDVRSRSTASHGQPQPSEPEQPDTFSPSPSSSTPISHNPLEPLPVDPTTLWYANAYPDQALRTFHCEKVRKMPLSGLDPSMLLGFLVRDEADWEDFVDRANKLPQKIFSVQDEPPTWDVDSDGGLESVSSEVDPEIDEPSLDDEEIRGVPIVSSRAPATLSRATNDDDDDEDGDGDADEAGTELGHENTITRGRRSSSDERRISVNTTVPAVDIATRMGRVELDDEAKDDESWTESGTPASQRPVLIDRNEVEPPSPSPIPPRQQSNLAPAKAAGSGPDQPDSTAPDSGREHLQVHARSQSQTVPSGLASTTTKHADQIEGNGNRDSLPRPKAKGKRPVSHPHMPQRTRTESWVDPGSGGREAPNGMSML